MGQTREFIEKIFASDPKYNDIDRQIRFLEIEERQKYNYYCDGCSWGFMNGWSPEEQKAFNDSWDEIIMMIDERKKLKNEQEKEVHN